MGREGEGKREGYIQRGGKCELFKWAVIGRLSDANCCIDIVPKDRAVLTPE
jgi:hypothetical protein